MKLVSLFSPKFILRTINFWPPFLFSGIRIVHFTDDLTEIKVRKTNSFWNQNYFGTHFGGALYAMSDPFYAFILLEHLRQDHIVWDKAASIDFIQAVPEPVHAVFSINLAEIERIREKCLETYKLEPVFHANIIDNEGQIVAKVRKTLYVRRKDAKTRFAKTRQTT